MITIGSSVCRRGEKRRGEEEKKAKGGTSGDT